MGAQTLRLWLSAPLQSWATSSRFEVRSTDPAPSKSGVVGLVGAAMGRRRNEGIGDVAALRFGVRVERPGTILRDFHTAGAGTTPIAVASGARSSARGIVSERYYLEDAAFVVGFEGGAEEADLLTEMRKGLESPRWPLALGRRSCPPSWPLVDSTALFPGSLEEALARPWWPGQADQVDPPGVGAEAKRLARRESDGQPTRVELRIEDPAGESQADDQLLGERFADRTFRTRRFRSKLLPGEAI